MQRQLRLLLAAVLLSAPAAHAITIIVTYGGSIPTAAQTIFNQVVANYDAEFSNLSLTGANSGSTGEVNITVDFGPTGLGQSTTNMVLVSYGTWMTAMQSDSTANPSNTDLASGSASLPSSNPLGANTCSTLTFAGCVVVTSADARALGLTQGQVAGCINPTIACTTLQPDSALLFSDAANVFDFQGGSYSFQNVAEHELDEALAVNSTLTGLFNGAALPSRFAAEDFFRYTPAGGTCNGVTVASITRCFSTSGSDTVFFSPDSGVTDVAQFFQNGSGADRNDWIYGSTSCNFTSQPGPFVQDAFGCPGTTAPNIAPGAAATPELAVLNTLGYDSVTTPEPGTLALIAGGMCVLLIRRKRAA